MLLSVSGTTLISAVDADLTHDNISNNHRSERNICGPSDHGFCKFHCIHIRHNGFIVQKSLHWRCGGHCSPHWSVFCSSRYTLSLSLFMILCSRSVMWCPGFAAIRVYAINGLRWKMAAVVMVLGLVPVSQNIYIISVTSLMYTPDSCTLWTSLTFASTIESILISQVCLVLSNLLVVVATWYAARSRGTIASSDGGGSLMTILIRDGIAHFAVVVALNVANIVALLLTKGVFSFTGASELCGYSLPELVLTISDSRNTESALL